MTTAAIRLPSAHDSQTARDAAKALSPALRKHSAHMIKVRAVENGSGKTVSVPREAFELFLEILGQMANGNSVTLMPIHAELTTQEAAELLGVSRPHLVKMLGEKKIPYRLVGTHRRVRAVDLFEYKRKDEKTRKAVLDELAREAQKHGLGY